MAAPITGIPDNDLEYFASRFSIDITTPQGKKIDSIFREVTGLSYEVKVVDVQEAAMDGRALQRKRPGQVEFGDIVLKRTLSPDKTFYQWAADIRDGIALTHRTNGSIHLHDLTGAIIGTWEFQNAWISKWSASDLDVGSDDPIIEEVTLAVESVKRVK